MLNKRRLSRHKHYYSNHIPFPLITHLSHIREVLFCLSMDKIKSDYFIAVDPDVSKSGVALLNRATKHLELMSLSFPELITLMIKKKAEYPNANFIVEAGWLNRGNWHLRYYDNNRQSAMKGYQVGRNHEVGMKIIEMARYFGYNVQEVKPLRKCWQGAGRKITAEELALFTGYKKRSTQDARDAALLAWSGANLPILMRRTAK